MKALVDYTVEWNVLGKDKKQEWGVASTVGICRIKDGVCTYSFAAHLRYKLYNPRIYTKLNLRLQNRFTHRYALILWEVCFDYFDIARNQGETPFIPMETFRDLMGLDKDEYPRIQRIQPKCHQTCDPGNQRTHELFYRDRAETHWTENSRTEVQNLAVERDYRRFNRCRRRFRLI